MHLSADQSLRDPRYSVEAEQRAQGGGVKKKFARRIFSLRDSDDGWETIQEAQNAVATLALYEVGLFTTSKSKLSSSIAHTHSFSFCSCQGGDAPPRVPSSQHAGTSKLS